MAEKCLWCAGCLFIGKQVPGISHCGSCEESYCKSHLDQHAKRRLTSLHEVIAIESDGLAELEEQPHIHTFCGVHVSEEIKGFCDGCNIVICGACLFGLHKEHKYRSLGCCCCCCCVFSHLPFAQSSRPTDCILRAILVHSAVF